MRAKQPIRYGRQAGHNRRGSDVKKHGRDSLSVSCVGVSL